MNEHPTEPEPQSASGEKPPIRKAQEEFIDDEARPSIDRSEYEERRTSPDTAGEAEHAAN